MSSAAECAGNTGMPEKASSIKPVDEGTGTSTVADGSREDQRNAPHQVEDEANLGAQIPPADRGFHAWAYLASAWFLDFLIWGLAFTYGVFLDFYKTHDFPNSSPGLIALPGSLCNGILYLSTIFIMPFVFRFPEYNNKAMGVGYIICLAGLVGAAFSVEAWHLVVTQGVLFSLGGSNLVWCRNATLLSLSQASETGQAPSGAHTDRYFVPTPYGVLDPFCGGFDTGIGELYALPLPAE
ncbi:hypothetical protein AAF712_003019 [Marasmius tenuissimus]|uniref:Uncharacterized protein n=1 Tax=Marasmius tenuissimus TaxID=585030 RepID=A0ABR3A6Z7_9AGAR